MTQQIKLQQLENDTRNANVCGKETLEKLKRNIERSGRCPALIVRPHPKKKDRYILIDGHHRKLVLEHLGWPEAPCEIWDVSEAEAGLLLATLNRLRGEDNLRKRAELLDGLLVHFPMEDITQLIPETEAQVKDLMTLLTWQEEELASLVKKQREEEATQLPVLLNFVLNKADAEIVERTLKQYQPEGNADPSAGLVALCKSIAKGVEDVKEEG